MSSRIGVAAVLLFVVACGDDPPAQQGFCGDGAIDPGEACDQGADNGVFGVGCTTACTFVCADPLVDCDAPLACQTAICTSDHLCGYAADPTQDGMTCGTNLVCLNGSCGSSGECGNGILDGTEECDFGQENGEETGCETNCTFSCADASDCDDGNACTGDETCDPVTVSGHTGQKCNLGTPPDNGTACGTGLICLNEACTAGSCGDSYTAGIEECDDADNIDGDGCDTDCTFSCVSSDITRNCTPADACQGQGTCNDTTHTCTAGTPLDNDTPCGTGGYCKTGTCTQPMCGNSDVEPGEDCDDGTANGTSASGCKSDCTWVCVNAANDCGTPPECNQYQCGTDHRCEVVADASQDGMSCGSGDVCQSGSCITPGAVCGDGAVEGTEQCDFGTGFNGPGTGCETNCTYSCTTNPNSCDDGNACNGMETCQTVMVNGGTGQACTDGSPLQDNTSCGTGLICKFEACVASVCGDSYVDSSIGESCEPPNTMMCDSQCREKVCGNGERSDDEQCDDGNLTKLDGCDNTCKLEQVVRATDIKVAFNTTTFCPANALGTGAVAQQARDQITEAIDLGVGNGSISIMFQMLGLDDLSGTNDNTVQVGVLSGSPVSGATYENTLDGNGNIVCGSTPSCDRDWWYTTDATTIDVNRTPTTIVDGSITNKVLDLPGPANMAITVNFAGVDVTMDMFGVKIRGTINTVSAPLQSTSGTPPGHLASENLDGTLQSFESIGEGANASDRLQFCGNTKAQSLENTILASSIAQSCAEAGFTTSHTLLDLFVSGCRVFFGLVTVVRATQPDTSTDGATYRFQADSNKFVVSCTRDGAPHDLADCMDKAGFSTLIRMRMGRMIAK